MSKSYHAEDRFESRARRSQRRNGKSNSIQDQRRNKNTARWDHLAAVVDSNMNDDQHNRYNGRRW